MAYQQPGFGGAVQIDLTRRGKKWFVTGNVAQYAPQFRQLGGRYQEYADGAKGYLFGERRGPQIQGLVNAIRQGQVQVVNYDLPPIPAPKDTTPKVAKPHPPAHPPAGMMRAVFDVPQPEPTDTVVINLGPLGTPRYKIVNVEMHPYGFIRKCHLQGIGIDSNVAIVITDGQWKALNSTKFHEITFEKAAPVGFGGFAAPVANPPLVPAGPIAPIIPPAAPVVPVAYPAQPEYVPPKPMSPAKPVEVPAGPSSPPRNVGLPFGTAAQPGYGLPPAPSVQVQQPVQPPQYPVTPVQQSNFGSNFGMTTASPGGMTGGPQMRPAKRFY